MVQNIDQASMLMPLRTVRLSSKPKPNLKQSRKPAKCVVSDIIKSITNTIGSLAIHSAIYTYSNRRRRVSRPPSNSFLGP